MKKLLTAFFGVLLAVFGLSLGVEGAQVITEGGRMVYDWRIGVYGGVEKEEGGSSGGRGTIQASGILQLAGNFGLQGGVGSGWGAGWRFGLDAGPVLDFGAGKVGAFVNYQYRALRDNSFVHIKPSLALYFNQTNLNFSYSHPLTGGQNGGGRREFGSNRLQLTFDYFNAMDWGSFLRRDNVELTGGLQINSFAGKGHNNFDTGWGPVLGLKFMPVPNLGVNLFRLTFDFNESRYRLDSGVEYYFGGGSPTLKKESREYLENDFTEWARINALRVKF